MAAALGPLPRRRRPAARLLATAVALFAAAGVLLAAAVLNAGRVQLHVQLPLPGWAGQQWEQVDPAQQPWLERMPPLPTGDAAQPTGGDADDPLAVLGPDYVGEEGAVRVVHVPQSHGSVSSSRFSGGGAATAAAVTQQQPAATVADQAAAAAAAAERATAGSAAAAAEGGSMQPPVGQAVINATAAPQGACSQVRFCMLGWAEAGWLVGTAMSCIGQVFVPRGLRHAFFVLTSWLPTTSSLC